MCQNSIKRDLRKICSVNNIKRTSHNRICCIRLYNHQHRKIAFCKTHVYIKFQVLTTTTEFEGVIIFLSDWHVLYDEHRLTWTFWPFIKRRMLNNSLSDGILWKWRVDPSKIFLSSNFVISSTLQNNLNATVQC